jgi:hypothetical protein
MTGKKISELQALTELTGTEIIPVAKDGQNYGVETLALLGISVYDIPEPLDDNYIYTPEQLAEIKKSIEDGKIIRFGGWSMPTVYFLEDDGEMVFDIDNGDWSRVIFTIKANGEWEINPPVDFFNYVVEMPNIVEGEELTGTLPAETFGDLLERLERSGNVMFRYPQAGSSNPVNQYDIGISFRYYRTNVTIIHAGGTREFSIIPSGNYTDRPVVSKQYQLITTRLNDYMYDMNGLLGKLAVRDGTGTDLKNLQQGHVFNINGELVGNKGFYQYINIEDTKIYYLKLLDSGLANYELCLFDHNDKLIKSIGDPTNGYFIFVGVAKIGVCSGIESLANAMIIKSFDIQDLTTVLNTQQGNRALYVAAGAKYNEQTGFYELNGLTDITEEQMKTIYTQTHGAQRMHNRNNVFEGANTIRTNLPFISYFGIGLDGQFRCAFLNCAALETACVTSSIAYAADVSFMFERCPKLKKIIGQLDIRSITSDANVARMFSQCGLLEDVRISSLKVNISFAYSPLISIESLQYLITNAANTSPITVTVHADVYAKIQDETQTEWHALLAAAEAKQITFATA